MVLYKEIVESLEDEFSQAFDFIAKELVWNEEHIILCYYSTMIDTAAVMEQLQTIQKSFEAGEADYGQTAFSEEMTFTINQFKESICAGETVIVFPRTDKMIRILLPKIASREPSSPENEYVVRGAHDGFVENLDVNINLIRKKLKSPDLKIENIRLGQNQIQLFPLFI